jgi:uncharacterized protein YcbK (DUF882 family)
MTSPRTPKTHPGALNRRALLRTLAGVCGAVGASRLIPARAAEQAAAAGGEAGMGAGVGTATPRTLRFVHTHTDETLTATYFDGADYDPDSLQAIDHLLRDFRNDEVHPIDPALLDLLHAAQTVAARDTPFEVISGYRSPATNAMLRGHSSGVAEHSQHLLGKAIDVRLRGLPTTDLHRIGLSLARGGVGYYRDSDFVHLDTGPVRRW